MSTSFAKQPQEEKLFLTAPFEIKALSDGEFEGYGSTFGNVDLGGDVIVKGAFSATLAEHKAAGSLPAMFWTHRMDQVPGKWLAMEEDSKGLYVKGQFAPTQLGNDTRTLLKMDAVRGLSIGYTPSVPPEYRNDGVRILKAVDLYEVSVVAIPMNPKAQVNAVKSLLLEQREDGGLAELKRECEKFLRTQGLAKQSAMERVAKFFEATAATAEIPDPTRATPDEIEVNEGLSSFHEKLLLHSLNKTLRRLGHGQ